LRIRLNYHNNNKIRKIYKNIDLFHIFAFK